MLVATLPWGQLFRLGKDSNTSLVFYHFFPVHNSQLLSPSMPLIKALQTCNKLFSLVVNPGFYCLVISWANVWHFIHLSLLIFPQQHEYFPKEPLNSHSVSFDWMPSPKVWESRLESVCVRRPGLLCWTTIWLLGFCQFNSFCCDSISYSVKWKMLAIRFLVPSSSQICWC